MIRKWICLLYFAAAVSATGQNSAMKSNPSPDLAKLLSRLDLSRSQLSRIPIDKPELTGEALLTYFRTRTTVKHPVDRTERPSFREKHGLENEIAMADNALKHIFVGQPSYPPYFCGEEINWAASPVPDKEWLWQLHRMRFWDAMGRAYWHTGDEKYAEEWAAQMMDWIAKNPCDAEHDYAWRTLEAGIRGYRWTGLFHYFVDSPAFTPERLAAFLNSCHDHAEYLVTHATEGNNWAVTEAEGLAFLAITFPEFKRAETWLKDAVERLSKEMERQVFPDGHQRELTLHYHMVSLEGFLRTFQFARQNGRHELFPRAFLTRLERMCEAPMKLGFPDGTIPQFGDCWMGRPGQYKKRFREWARLFGRDDFLFLATEGTQGTPPSETAFAFPDAGLYSMRSGWTDDAVMLVLKCGPDGGWHCQPDNGTFELYAGGRNLMPDSGAYIYHSDDANRAWFQQTSVHQTLTLDGRNSAYAPRLLLWKPGRDLDILVVENESYEDLRHRRAVFFVNKRYFIIVDDALGPAEGIVDLHFQFAPGDLDINARPLTAQTAYGEGWNVHVRGINGKDTLLEEEEGRVAFAYREQHPRPAIRFRKHKRGAQQGTRFLTVIAPYQDEPPQITAKALDDSPPGGSRLELDIVENGVPKRISCELPQ
jgi:heparan-sulfate lyase